MIALILMLTSSIFMSVGMVMFVKVEYIDKDDELEVTSGYRGSISSYSVPVYISIALFFMGILVIGIEALKFMRAVGL